MSGIHRLSRRLETIESRSKSEAREQVREGFKRLTAREIAVIVKVRQRNPDNPTPIDTEERTAHERFMTLLEEAQKSFTDDEILALVKTTVKEKKEPVHRELENMSVRLSKPVSGQ